MTACTCNPGPRWCPVHRPDRAAHWSHDPTDDLSWNNYAAGYDAGRAHLGDEPDLTGHSQPYVDGFRDGTDERNTR